MRVIKIRYILLTIIFCSALSFKAHNKKDSLIKVIAESPEDTSKVNALLELARQYDYFNSKERVEYFISGFNLSKKLNYKKGIINSATLLITNLSHRQLYDVALEYCNNYIGYLNENNEGEELQKIYKLYATLLSKQGKYKESLDYNYKALNYYQSKGDEIQYATVLSNISILHLNNNQVDSAYLFNIRTIDLFRKNNKQSELANSILGLAEIFYARKDYKNARIKAFESLDIYSTANIELGVLNAYTIIGNINFSEAKADSAIYYYDKTLELLKKYPLSELKRDCYLSISKCYAVLKKPELAYSNHVLYSAYNDSVSTERLKSKTLEMDAKYSIAKKEGELKEKEFVIQNQNKQRNFLVLGLVGIVVLLLILYRGYIQKKKANHEITEQKRLVEEKQKEIVDSIRYAKRIQQSLMPTEKYIQRIFHPGKSKK